MKRILTILLVMLVLVGMIPVTAMAANVKITTQPKSVTVADGAKATVSLKATGDGLSYTWYYKNKGVSSFSKTDSFTGNSYSVTMSSSRDGRQVYCVVKDKYGNSVKSNVATLSMGSAVKITTQPKSVTVAEGAKATVSLKATGDGLSYTWYYKNKGANSFSKTTSFTGNSYSVTMSASRSGRQVYCVVKDKYGNSVKSDVATLSMGNTVKITTQPKSVTAADGAKATVSLKATGDGLSYTWYYKNKGASSFSKTTSFTGNSYSVTMSSSRDGRQVYCVVKDKYGNSVKSDVVTISMGTPMNFTRQPYPDYQRKVGEAITLYVAVTGGEAPYTYQWQCMSDINSQWTNIEADFWWATGGETATLVFVLEEEDFDSHYRYRCVVTDATGNKIISRETCFKEVLNFRDQDTTVWASLGDTVYLDVWPSGGTKPYTYKWYIAQEGYEPDLITEDVLWASGQNTGTLSFTVEQGDLDKFWYYCVVEDATGNAIRSDNIFVEQEMYIVSQTTEVIAAYDEIKTMSVSVVGGSGEYTYQWQYKCDGLYAYKDIDASWASGYTTDTLSARIGEVDFDSNYSYRCVILDSAGNCVISEPIVPKRAVYVENQTAKVYVDAGEITTMYVQPAGGSGNYSYQWYEYQEGYVDLKITSSHSEWASGYTTSVLDIHVYNSHRIGLAYYCVITDVTTGHTVTSEKIFVTQRP